MTTIPRTPIRVLLLALAATLALVACQGAAKKSGIPITGTLTEGSGSSAPLTISAGLGVVFVLNATLGSSNVVSTSPQWICYAPDPPTYPNYDIEGTDGANYGLFISVAPLYWTTGAHPIDGVNVKLLVAAADRFGVATNGTLVLTTVGTIADSAGNNCGFKAIGVPLTGDRDG
jgi:hypothetical protein